MPLHLRKVFPAGVLLGLTVALTAGVTPAQQTLPALPPPGGGQPAQFAQADPNQPAAGDNQTEVLARGPVHEAFATTAEAPVASPVVAQEPPEPIEELPPEDKPEGENVLWIPGYWHWDDDADRYIWISGFWRVAPPGRVWVPGSWRDVRGGHQWAAGFWQETLPPQAAGQPAQEQPEIQYLPPPPASVEVGPTTPALTQTSFYVPGSWVWRGRFLWRPGFWIEHRPNWVWVPAHYRWSPLGYIFVEGYWDYPLATRGVLYAPVYFPRPVYAQPAFVYTPAYVVSEPAMVGALFVRRGFGAYYFGDYFAPRYSNVGFTAWCGTFGGGGGGFAIGFGTGRAWGYDPLWSYYSVRNRQNVAWNTGVANLYGGRYAGTVPRPPVNLVQQNTVINRITNVNNVTNNVTNVTNNITVVNKHVTVNNTNVTDVAMLAPAKAARDLQPEVKVQPISAQVRKDEAARAQEIRSFAVDRRKLETAAVAKGPVAVPKGNEPAAPQSLKIEVPKAIAARARVADERKAPPANPHRDQKAAQKVDPNGDRGDTDPHPVFTPKIERKTDPKLNPKIDPKDLPDPKGNPKVNPKFDPKDDPDPKVNPKVNPKVDPNPKIDPTPKVNPKVDPNPKMDPLPKVNPKVDPLPKVNPKVDPKVGPKVDPNPKVDPQPKVTPKVNPPVDPLPKVNPPVDPVPNPKVNPKRDPKDDDPDPRPKGNPKRDPKDDPLPKVEPKQPKQPPVVQPQPQPQPVPQPKVQPQPMPQPQPQPKQPPVVPKQPVPQPQPQPMPQPQPQPKQPPKGEPKEPREPKKDRDPKDRDPKDRDPESFAPPVNPAPVVRSPAPVPQPVQPVRPLVTPAAQPQPARVLAPAQPRQPVPVPKAQPRPQTEPQPRVQPRVQPVTQPRPAPQPKAPDRGNKDRGDRNRN